MPVSTNYDIVISLVLYKPDIKQLRKTLNSVQNTDLKIKIQVLDNSPEPASTNLFDEHSNVEYRFNDGQNLGFGKAHNLNITQNQGTAKYFLVLNPDVYFSPKILQEIYQRMELDSSIGLSIPKICFPSGKIQRVNRRLPRPQDYLYSFISKKTNTKFFWTESFRKYLLLDMDLQKPLICPVISGCFMFLRASCLEKIGGFDERFFLYLEDTDLSRRVSENYKTVIFSDIEAYHHWQQGAHKSIKLFVTQAYNTMKYFNKWGWFSDQKRKTLNKNVCYYEPRYTENPKLIRTSTPLNSVEL